MTNYPRHICPLNNVGYSVLKFSSKIRFKQGLKYMANIYFLFLWLPVAFTLGMATEEFNPEDYRQRDVSAIRLSKPIQIDGNLQEVFYTTPPCTIFIQLDPDNGQLASEKTEVWIGYEDDALYIGARLWDSRPDSIIGHLGRRDRDEDSDQFQVAIDSYYDKRSGYFFTINPVGTISDGTIANDSQVDDNWDGVWDGRSQINEQDWTVEMRIPFSQLRFTRHSENIMGIEFGRVIQRKKEHSLYTYIPRGSTGIVSHFATLYGIRDIEPPKRVEFIPYISTGYGRLPSSGDNPFYGGQDTKVGIGTDVKLGIGNNLTIDATFNPDFGQVEVDPSVINLSAYETFYSEKRPFFIEGSGIFAFGEGGPSSRWGFNFSEPSFFYSRRVGRPPQGYADGKWVKEPTATSILGAAKLSGKLKGQWSLGGFTALTDREYAEVLDGDANYYRQEVEPLTSYNLLRLQKEFHEGRQGIGIIGSYVYRFFDDNSLTNILNKEALTAGVDTWTFLNKDKDWVLAGWWGYSEVKGSKTRLTALQQNSSHYFQRPDADHVTLDTNRTQLNGYASRLILNRETGHVTFNAGLGIISPGFESNDLGLTFGTDKLNKHLVLGYKWYDPGKIFRNAGLNAAYASNHNFGGVKINEMYFLFGYAQFLNYWSINGFSGWGPRTFSDTILRGGPMVISPEGKFMNLGFSSDSRKKVIGGANAEGGDSEKGGKRRSVGVWINIQAGTRLRLTFNPNFSVSHSIDQYITTLTDTNNTIMYGKRYLLGTLDQQVISTDIRIDYTLTPTLSIQSYFQPFIAVGAYSEFKEFQRPKSYSFFIYGKDETSLFYDASTNRYLLDPTGGDTTDVFTIGNPDFNYKALVGNVVLRWEFKPGSTLYLVWTHNSTNFNHPGEFKVWRDLKDLFKSASDDLLAIKLTYWFGQ